MANSSTHTLQVVFVGNTQQLQGQLGSLGNQVNQQQGKWRKLGDAMKKGLAVGAAGAAVGMKKATDAAVDLNEEVNKSAVVFRGSEKPLLKWSKTTATSLGISQRAALEATGTFGNMLVPMGFARKKARDMSVGLVKLSADMASFNNADPSDVLEALRSGLSGETEPLRKFGVFLNDARLKQEAMNLGLKNAIGPNGALTANAKAQATYSLILKDTKDAQGDFARTSDSLANKQRILKAQGEQAAASLGKFLIPVMTTLANWASKVGMAFTSLSPGMQKAVVIGISLVAALTPIILIASKLTTAITVLVPVVVSIAGAIGTAAVAVGGFVVAAAPFLLAAAAIGAIAFLIWKNWDSVSGWLVGAWDWVKNAAVASFDAVKGVVVGAWNAISSATSTVWNGISTFLTTAWKALTLPVRIYFTFYKELITGVWNIVKGLTLLVWNAIDDKLKAVWGGLKTAVTTYFNAYKTVITGVWNAVKTVTTTVWNGVAGWLSGKWDSIKSVASTGWGAIKGAITGPVGSAIDTIKDLIGHGGKDKKGLIGWLSSAWDTITKGASDFGGAVGKAVSGAFKGVVGSVLKFAIKILEVVGKIPGVDFGGTIKNLQGVGKTMGVPGFAKGGVMEAGGPGGKITRPLAVVGEQAPRHEEYIVPTNPAYRGRALGLFGALGSKLGVPGFAKGGVLGYDTLKSLAGSVGAPDPGLMAAVALAESSGKTDAFGPPSGRGLWQIEWNVWAKHMAAMGLTNPNDPQQNARMMMEVLKQQGIHAWVAYNNGSYKKFMKGGGGGGLGGLFGKIGGALGHLMSQGAGWILDKLPDPSKMLPEWIGGLGKEVIGQVSGWIKRKVSNVLGFGGGDGEPTLARVVRNANLIGAKHYQYIYGGGHVTPAVANPGLDCSSSVSMLLQKSGFNVPTMTSSGYMHWGAPGRGKDLTIWSNPDHVFAEIAGRMWGTSNSNPNGGPGWANHGTAGFTATHPPGFARGGVVRVGENGPEDAWLPNGTRVRNASDTAHRGRGDGPLIDTVNITNTVDEREVARQLAWLVS